MRKPVVVFIKGELFLCTAIRFHSPYLVGTGIVCVKIDPFTIGRIFRAICTTYFRKCELYFRAAINWFFTNLINGALTDALTGVYHFLPIGAPSMQLVRSTTHQHFGFTSGNGNNINSGTSIGPGAAKPEPFSIKRDHMVIVIS